MPCNIDLSLASGCEPVDELHRQIDRPLPARNVPRGDLARPVFRIEKISRSHGRKRSRGGRIRVDRVSGLVRLRLLSGCIAIGNEFFRFAEAALLQISVLEPVVVMAAGARRQASLGPRLVDHAHRRLVRRDDLVPHAHRHEDVRAHVLRVTRRRRDLRVDARGAKAERRVDRIVVRVNEVVRKARMIRMRGKNRFENCGRPHIDGEVAAVMRGSQQRQRIKCRRIHVVRILSRQARQRLGKREVAAVLVAVAVQDFDGAHVIPLALGLRFRHPRIGRRCKPCEGCERRVAVLLHPHRVRVGHRFAPVGHGEVGVELLRLAE